MPRPDNEEFLHPECKGWDFDVAPFYEVAHWREAPDEMVESNWAAPHFFSAPGWHHFAPAFMAFGLRRAGEGTAAVQATIMTLTNTDDFTVSKLVLFDDNQRAVAQQWVEQIRTTDPWPPG